MLRFGCHIAGACLLIFATMVTATEATTIAQTQLVGVKGATVIVFVSQYLPPEVKALEPDLKSRVEAMLKSSGMSIVGGRDQYLTVDVRGDAVSNDVCTHALLLQIVVAFSEPVRLTRAPEQRLPNNNTVDTWKEVYQNVVPQSGIEDLVTTRVKDAVELFIDTVQSVNRSVTSKK